MADDSSTNKTQIDGNSRSVSCRFHVISWILIGLAALLCLWATFWRLAPPLNNLPTGCDDFGYLHQAEAIKQGRWFDNHTERPFFKALIADLSSKTSNPQDYQWMVTPHAYRYNPDTGRTINQYPPGTSLILAPFSFEYRKLAYPFIVFASMLSLLFLFRKDSGWLLLARASALLCLVMLCARILPFVAEFGRVGSVAPTFALLIAAGWFLRSKPIVSIALVSASMLFRISNVWLIPIIALPCVFSEYFSDGRLPGWRNFIIRSLKVAGTAFVFGIVWILLFQWFTMGDPLKTTYPPYDQEVADFKRILVNIAYYFDLSQGWFAAHLAALAGVSLFYFSSKEGRKWIAWAVLLVLWNYLFFLIHNIQVYYYANASVFLLLGLLISGIDVGVKPKFLKATTAVFAVTALVCFVLVCPHHYKNPTKNILNDRAQYVKLFEKTDVIWAEDRTGTVEYATGKAGFRFSWSTKEMRLEAMRWLATNGYSQAILLDDVDMNSEEALNTLKETGLKYTIQNTDFLQRIAWLETASSPEAR